MMAFDSMPLPGAFLAFFLGARGVMEEPDPLVLDRLIQVGNICRQWAYVEYLFSVVIWAALKLDRETGMIVTGGLDMLPRANMAINLAKHLNMDASIREALTNARATLQAGSLSLVDKRNIAVHGLELRTQGTSSTMEVHRGKGAFREHEFGNDQLREIGAAVQKIHEQLSPVMKSVGMRWI